MKRRYLYDILLQERELEDGKIPEKYKDSAIEGDFICSNLKLSTLENCPQIIKGDFDCSENFLKTLEECPKVVLGSFRCSDNNLISLEYSPTEVRTFWAEKNQLVSLQGISKRIYSNCWVDQNPYLNSLDGCPEFIGGKFKADNFTDEQYREFIQFADLRNKLPELKGIF